MANYAKYSRSAIGHLAKHYERGKDSDGEYVRFGNQSIDLERTHLNYNLATHGKNQVDFIHDRLEEVYCMNRDDVVVMASCVVTVPKSVPEECYEDFFERAYNFLKEKHGEKNVISAYVHMDETTPHLHFAFMPIVYDEKKNREKVCCKDVLTKSYLKGFHDELQAVMNDFVADYGYIFPCDMINGSTDGGNLKIQGLKAETLKAMNEETREELAGMRDEIRQLQTQIKMFRDQRDALALDDDAIVQRFINKSDIRPLYDRYVEQTKRIVQEQRRRETGDKER